LPWSKTYQKSGPFPPPELPGIKGRTTLSDTRPKPSPFKAPSRPLPSSRTGLPRLPALPFPRAVPTTPADRTGACVDDFPVHTAFPASLPGRHPHMPFEACSGFTHITAHGIAQPPKAAFVTRLRPRQLPSDAARQLPDQSTSIWMEPSSIGKTRLRGAQRSEAIHVSAIPLWRLVLRLARWMASLRSQWRIYLIAKCFAHRRDDAFQICYRANHGEGRDH
jgi:hypothetical protein